MNSKNFIKVQKLSWISFLLWSGATWAFTGAFYSDIQSDYRVANEKVYYQDKHLDSADFASFRNFANPELAKDKSQVFFRGEALANVDSAKLVLKDYDNQYYTDGKKVFASIFDNLKATGWKQQKWVPIDGAEPKSFSAINKVFAKDAKRFYFRDIRNQEVRSFGDGDLFGAKALKNCYLKTRDNVYYQSQKISSTQAFAFQLLHGENYCIGKDKTKIYQGALPLRTVDKTSFQPVKGQAERELSQLHDLRYYKDFRQVYRADFGFLLPMSYADAASFEVLSHRMAKDKYFNYLDGQIQPPVKTGLYDLLTRKHRFKVDKKNFKLLAHGQLHPLPHRPYKVDFLFSSDKDYVYYNEKRVEGADVDSFRVISQRGQATPYAIDKDKVYFGAYVIPAKREDLKLYFPNKEIKKQALIKSGGKYYLGRKAFANKPSEAEVALFISQVYAAELY